MATYLDGNVRKATTNTVKAMVRSAESRKCPECGRKSALKFLSDEYRFGHYCRWTLEGKCTYDHVLSREAWAEKKENEMKKVYVGAITAGTNFGYHGYICETGTKKGLWTSAETSDPFPFPEAAREFARREAEKRGYDLGEMK